MPQITFSTSRVFNVTPNNALPIRFGGLPVIRLYIGVGGNVAVRSVTGDIVLFTELQSGSYLDARITHVFVTGTTATWIVALWDN